VGQQVLQEDVQRRIKSVAGTASCAGNGFKLLSPARLKSPCETSATKLSSPSAKAAPESQIAVYWLDLGMIGFFASVALGFAVYAGCPNLKIAVS
jgi:hypothetical protein